jgi:hypothetical protein
MFTNDSCESVEVDAADITTIQYEQPLISKGMRLWREKVGSARGILAKVQRLNHMMQFKGNTEKKNQFVSLNYTQHPQIHQGPECY